MPENDESMNKLFEAIMAALAAYRAAETFGEESLSQRMLCVSTLMNYMNDASEAVAGGVPNWNTMIEDMKRQLLDEIKGQVH